MTTAIPYTVKIINASQNTKPVVIFDIDYYDKYVIIETGTPHSVSYKEMIQCLEISSLKCIRIDILWRSLGMYNTEMDAGVFDRFDKKVEACWTKGDMKNTFPFAVKVDPFQPVKNMNILYAEFPLQKDTTVKFNIPGESEFNFDFYTR